jgi:hypothetical protein
LVNFLERVGAMSKKINMWFIIPTFFLYIIVAGVATIVFPNQTLPILLGMIVLVVFSNMIQGRLVNKKVREENKIAQDQIREFLGNERFDGLVKSQEDHYQEYFKFNEEPVVNQEEIEVVENSNENNGEDKDGTKAINAIRFLGVDAINVANSGHPGIVLGSAPWRINYLLSI